MSLEALTWSTVTPFFRAKFWRMAVKNDCGKKKPPSQNDSGLPFWTHPRKNSIRSARSVRYLDNELWLGYEIFLQLVGIVPCKGK